MTQVGDYILVDPVEAQEELQALLKQVTDGRHVRIMKDGTTIAEIHPPRPAADRLQMHPDLRVTFAPDYDPTEGLSEDDWPEHLR
jgi:antitoxin (DNA-binding transcriptional repressor) of toxin-antitoxin stability system